MTKSNLLMIAGLAACQVMGQGAGAVAAGMETGYPRIPDSPQGYAVPMAMILLASGSGQSDAVELRLPEPFDRHGALVARYLDWLANETGAPAEVIWPRVTVEPLPASMDMGFFFPTTSEPWREMRIAVSPYTIDRAHGEDDLTVLGELAHEYAHFALLMLQNGWQAQREYLTGGASHHCDPEFQRLTAGMGPVIWDTYHSNDALRSIAFMINRACWLDGPSLNRRDR